MFESGESTAAVFTQKVEEEGDDQGGEENGEESGEESTANDQWVPHSLKSGKWAFSSPDGKRWLARCSIKGQPDYPCVLAGKTDHADPEKSHRVQWSVNRNSG